ncbi:MAG: hypothetical protein KGH62_02100 [Candidatus Micrarchaeota archaeon]|nr:hypothetical protein [Candidatus Micrarchaeota archaeon]
MKKRGMVSMKAQTNKGLYGWPLAITIIAVVGLVLWYGGGQSKSLNPSTGSGAGTNVYATVPTLNLSASSTDYTLLPPQPVAQATSYIVFNPANPALVLKSGSLSATTGTPLNVKPGQFYPIMIGQNGGTGIYNSLFSYGVGNNQTSIAAFTVYKASNPTVSVANALGVTPTANVFVKAAAATTITNITEYVRCGQQYTGKPGEHIVQVLSWNSPDISQAKIPNAAVYAKALPPGNFVAGQTTATGFVLPSCYNYQYVTPTGVSTGQVGFPVQIVTGNPFTANDYIGSIVQATTDYLLNGTVVTDALVDGTGANILPQIANARFIAINSA